MDKRVVLALAGSGKTYYIAHDFEKRNRVYMISFTNRNVENIRNEVRKRFNGTIPKNVMITTFDTFVYNQMLKPIEKLLEPRGIVLHGVEVGQKPVTDTRDRRYKSLDQCEHYITKNKIYVDRMSKLAIKQSDVVKTILLERLRRYCDTIYFDEFQDYNGNDFKLIEWILNKFQGNVVAVGDIYQSLVKPIRRDGNSNDKKPFSNIVTYSDLHRNTHFSKDITIVTDQLQQSRRVSHKITSFISENIGIPISGHKGEGEIIELNSVDDIDDIMRDRSIIKLIWNKKFFCNGMEGCVNWSYSKGDTYQDVCVVLTSSTDDISKWKELGNEVKNTLYVALTRAKRHVYLVHTERFKKWKTAIK